MKFLKRLTISIFLLSSLVISNANAGECKARLGDFDWSSANIHTAITTFILEKGYGCEVSVTKGSTTPIMAAHYDGQLDVITEVWYDNIIGNYKPHEEAGTIIHMGTNTPDSQQAFYVDKATADKYNLKSVEDMKDPKIAALFKDPEDPSKGRMTSCISGWTCYTVNLVKQKEYGLDKYYTNFDPGSGGALDAAIAGLQKFYCIQADQTHHQNSPYLQMLRNADIQGVGKDRGEENARRPKTTPGQSPCS